MIITMISHPGGKIGPAEVDHVARMLILVHSLALASIPVIFLGAWGMTRRIGGADRLAWAGLVVYALASIAVMNAAVCDGLMAPTMMRKIVAATPETRDMWQTLMNFNFQMNQAFARVYAVGSSLAAAVVVGVDFAVSDAWARNRDLWRGPWSGDGRGDLFGVFDSGPTWIRDVDFRAGDLVFAGRRRDVGKRTRRSQRSRGKGRAEVHSEVEF